MSGDPPACGMHPRGGWSCYPKVCEGRVCPMEAIWALYKGEKK